MGTRNVSRGKEREEKRKAVSRAVDSVHGVLDEAEQLHGKAWKAYEQEDYSVFLQHTADLADRIEQGRELLEEYRQDRRDLEEHTGGHMDYRKFRDTIRAYETALGRFKGFRRDTKPIRGLEEQYRYEEMGQDLETASVDWENAYDEAKAARRLVRELRSDVEYVLAEQERETYSGIVEQERVSAFAQELGLPGKLEEVLDHVQSVQAENAVSVRDEAAAVNTEIARQYDEIRNDVIDEYRDIEEQLGRLPENALRTS